MIGNDIIDLRVARAERKSKNARYTAKVFTQKEKEFMLNSEDPELILWQFWAMKEAAYKAHQRNFDLPRKLNPKAYVCDLSYPDCLGRVTVGHLHYDIEFEINSAYIHATTSPGHLFRRVRFNTRNLYSDIIKELSENSPFSSEDLELIKDKNGIPSFYTKTTSRKIPFSSSHHGKFSAFAIPLINS